MNERQFRDDAEAVANEIVEFLCDKNRKYGNSALEPVRILSSASADEQIRVRMDDKLSRLISNQTDDHEDTVDDFVGYRILQKILELRASR